MLNKKKEITELKLKLSSLDDEFKACHADLTKRDQQTNSYKDKIHELNQEVMKSASAIDLRYSKRSKVVNL